MSEENVKKFLIEIGKITINVVTLKPIFKKWISFRGLIYTWIVINLYWIGQHIFYVLTGNFDLDESSLFEIISHLNLIPILTEAVQIGVLLYLIKIYQFYAIGAAHQKLDLAKSLGILNSVEHEQKLLSAKKIQYIEEVKRMHEAGVFNLEQKNDLEKMAERHYDLRIKQIALKNALESGIISNEEYTQKNKAIVL